jgi:UDPglucose--hexose-1-phosphate uridylyltransferase
MGGNCHSPDGSHFLPPRDYCPLCPTTPGGFETEIERADFEIAVFENRFPSFHLDPPEPAIKGSPLFPVSAAAGVCEVVVYTPQHHGCLADLSTAQMRLLVRVWRDRYTELSARPEIKYVFIFENRGSEVGVTLHHPHGQIYAFTYLPPVPERELQSAAAYREENKEGCLFCAVVTGEKQDERRVVLRNDSFLAFVPFAARYPYEMHLYSLEHRPSLADLNDREIDDLAAILQSLVRCYDNLFGKPFPYIMVMHQEPAKERRDWVICTSNFTRRCAIRSRLKYLAGCEQGAGTYINDSLPEEKAAELRKAAKVV